METVKLNAVVRTAMGSNRMRALRREGKVPAVLYGHKIETVAIELDEREVEHVVQRGVQVVELQGEGLGESALIKEIQYDALGDSVIHLDFMRVSVDERVDVEIPVHLRGSAKGVAAGGVLDQVMHSVEVNCLALSIPESVTADVAALEIGDEICVRDLKFPEGVNPVEDEDAIVVTVRPPAAEPVEEEQPAEEMAEPEVIKREKEEETEEPPEDSKE